MKRRHFISVVSAGAIGASALRSYASAQDSRWRPDGGGRLARFGVLTPDNDPVPESEMWAMAPSGVSIHASRVPWNGEWRAFAEPPHVDNATEQVAALAPRAILYAFTSSSYALGAEGDGPLQARLQKRAKGIPVLLTCPVATEALRVLGSHRIAVINPPWFSEEVNAKGRDYFRSKGFDVVSCTRITPSRPFTEVPPAEIYEWAKTNVPGEAETVFIGGNGLRAAGTIHALEESLRKPVLTANQVLLWQALKLVGLISKVTQYGRIYTKS